MNYKKNNPVFFLNDCDLVDFDMFQSLDGAKTKQREKQNKKFLENYCWSIAVVC